MPHSHANQSPIIHHRVLAADDDPIMREMMMARLGEDVDVTCAENGQIAWEKLLEDDFDLAIIDLGMPKLDGFGLIRYLRQTPKTVDLPIIVATSRGDAEAIEKAFASGASGFVTKPINWSLFKYHVQFVLKNGLIKRQLRANKTENDLVIRAKDRLLEMMSAALEHQTTSTDLPIGQHVSNNSMADAIYMSRLLSANRPLSFNHNDANEIITLAVNTCRRTAADKSVKIIGRHSLANISINIDRQVWLEALTRLILLGVKSSPAGGTVEIMPGEQRDNSLVISVRDNGPIKSQAEIDSAMNILVDEKPVGLSSNPIPDLTLAIVKNSVEMLNGRVLFQNNAGEGNISALWLPAFQVQIENLEHSA